MSRFLDKIRATFARKDTSPFSQLESIPLGNGLSLVVRRRDSSLPRSGGLKLFTSDYLVYLQGPDKDTLYQFVKSHRGRSWDITPDNGLLLATIDGACSRDSASRLSAGWAGDALNIDRNITSHIDNLIIADIQSAQTARDTQPQLKPFPSSSMIR